MRKIAGKRGKETTGEWAALLLRFSINKNQILMLTARVDVKYKVLVKHQIKSNVYNSDIKF